MKRALLYLLLCIVPSQTLLAQDDAAILSENCEYLGRKSYLKPGIYRAYQLGITDNSLSSFHLPRGMALQVFDGDRYTGRTETFYSSVACLNNSWNDKTSSVKVYWINDPGNEGGSGGSSGNNLPPQGNKVIFYRDMKYSGMSRSMVDGNFGSGSLGFLTDNISSIYIPPGYSVRVNDRSGRTQTFTGSISNLQQYGWDNRINAGFIQGNYSGGGQGGNNGGTLPPQGNRVIFYRDMKYSGPAKDLDQGNFGAGTLGPLARNISSIYIPQGWSVQVRDLFNRVQTFSMSISNLAQYGWDNRILTGFINSSGGSQGGNNPETVKLFIHTNYEGSATPCGEGRINYVGSGTDNNISSIQLPAGFGIIVYDGQNLSGSYKTFTSSVKDLTPYGWNDRISSVYVYRL